MYEYCFILSQAEYILQYLGSAINILRETIFINIGAITLFNFKNDKNTILSCHDVMVWSSIALVLVYWNIVHANLWLPSTWNTEMQIHWLIQINVLSFFCPLSMKRTFCAQWTIDSRKQTKSIRSILVCMSKCVVDVQFILFF